MRILVEHDLRCEDLPVLTESTLRDLLINPGLLQRMQLPVRRQPFECDDFTPNRRRRRDAGADCRAVDDHCAGAALAKAASKLRPLQAEIIAKDVEQWRGGFEIGRAS